MPDRRETSRDASRGRPDAWSRAEIDAAIAGLNRAGRSFSQRLGGIPFIEGQAEPGLAKRPATENAPAEQVRGPDEASAERGQDAPAPDQRGPASEARSEGEAAARAADPLEERLQVAEREAREYLAQAKRRADSLVSTMIGAVERESADIRREAEERIRERWRQAEADAGRYVNEAREVADGMVHERQELIGELSDGIAARAISLTDGMDDAERIRRQFEMFVRALSRTADQIASGAPERSHPQPPRFGAGRSEGERSALAA